MGNGRKKTRSRKRKTLLDPSVRSNKSFDLDLNAPILIKDSPSNLGSTDCKWLCQHNSIESLPVNEGTQANLIEENSTKSVSEQRVPHRRIIRKRFKSETTIKSDVEAQTSNNISNSRTTVQGKRLRIDDEKDTTVEKPLKKCKSLELSHVDETVYYDAQETLMKTVPTLSRYSSNSDVSFKSLRSDVSHSSSHRNSRLSLKETPGKLKIRKTAIDLRRNETSETRHRRRRRTAGSPPSLTSRGASGKSTSRQRQARWPVKLTTSKFFDICSRVKIKGYRPTCGHVKRTITFTGMAGIPQNNAIEWKNSFITDFNMLKTKLEILDQENSGLKKVMNEMSEKIVSLESKIRPMTSVPVLKYSSAASPPPPPPPPPPPLLPSSSEVTNENFPICRVKGTVATQPELQRPSITLEDLKNVKLRKTPHSLTPGFVHDKRSNPPHRPLITAEMLHERLRTLNRRKPNGCEIMGKGTLGISRGNNRFSGMTTSTPCRLNEVGRKELSDLEKAILEDNSYYSRRRSLAIFDSEDRVDDSVCVMNPSLKVKFKSTLSLPGSK